MPSSFDHLISRILLIFCLGATYASAGISPDADTLLKRMEMAYAEVNDYRTSVAVRVYRDDGSFETEKFLYTFKKPTLIRLDLMSPHSGTIVVFPDEEGKAVVQPSGLAHILKLHLSTNSFLLREPSGQRLDQTDMGLLIRNISHSLTDQRRGPLSIAEENGRLRVRVPAVNHFREGVVTLYEFLIDAKVWLPVEARESASNGRPERTITFDNLKVNTGVPNAFFRLDEADGGNGRINGK